MLKLLVDITEAETGLEQRDVGEFATAHRRTLT
jgi:hypothetical protein